jgi:uroporphyrinogen decarboxylase
MAAILKGQAPDFPPHFEIEFQLEKEFFGIDKKAIEAQCLSESQLPDLIEKTDIQIKTRLVEELGHAAVPALFHDKRVDRIKSIENIKRVLGHKAAIFSYSNRCTYWMPTGGDIMDFVVMMYERPDEMHKGARMKCDAAKELSKQQADAGVDFILQTTDYGFNNGPFISPEKFKEFITPYMTEFITYTHKLGIPVIMHSDGDLKLLLDQIYSTGVDGYQSVDPQGGMDIKAVRAKYPDWILMGNVNCAMMQTGTENEMRESVRYCMEHGGIGKKFIFSTSNCIFKGMPQESYNIILDEYKKLINH